MQPHKIAIVSGGSSGIGFAIARKFTRQHIKTYIIGRNSDKLEKAADALGDYCYPIAQDLSDLSAIPHLVQDIYQKHRRIDILINNAGINEKKVLTEVSDEDFQRVINTNLNSVFAISREVLKVMIPQKSGNIINISSMAAHYGIPKVIAYTAAKTALEGITRAMAVEVSPLGIRVNCIAPGFIRTPMSAKALDNDPQRKNKVLSRTPMGKIGNPDDVANMTYFLTTEEAGFITGEVIKIDGGNSIGF